jgi:UDP-N-acetyl-D-mannosaminuronic acid dehydrogenase
MYEFKKISVIGLGYIGLPTAAMFASRKKEVIGIDVSPDVVETVNGGNIHIIEPDLDILVRSVVSQGYLRASTKPEPADAFVVAVPTPFKGDNREPDLSYIASASRAIAPALERGNLVILESTVPVGTTEAMARWLADARPDLTFPQTHDAGSDIRIAHCPERVLPGQVMRELINNDRVIGGMTPSCSAAASALYEIFVTGTCTIASSARSAEMVKLAENSFRDVNIAFANELSLVCDQLGIDVWELVGLANRHPRVDILNPGPGVGGHCIAVDPWFIVQSAPEQTRLIRCAREVNDSKPEWVIEKTRAAVGQHLLHNPQKAAGEIAIAIYGITFKADIDDLRESPALEIAINIARQHAGPLFIVEPNLENLPKDLCGAQSVDFKTATAKGDVHIMLVGHKEFKGSYPPQGLYVDACGIWQDKLQKAK